MNSMLLIASLMAMASSGDGTPADTQPTRGIGQYPGAPSEYFAPSVSWVESAQTLTNVALPLLYAGVRRRERKRPR